MNNTLKRIGVVIGIFFILIAILHSTGSIPDKYYNDNEESSENTSEALKTTPTSSEKVVKKEESKKEETPKKQEPKKTYPASEYYMEKDEHTIILTGKGKELFDIARNQEKGQAERELAQQIIATISDTDTFVQISDAQDNLYYNFTGYNVTYDFVNSVDKL